jgi:hypothetical protein
MIIPLKSCVPSGEAPHTKSLVRPPSELETTINHTILLVDKEHLIYFFFISKVWVQFLGLSILRFIHFGPGVLVQPWQRQQTGFSI